MKKCVSIVLVPVFFLNSISLQADLIVDMQQKNPSDLIQNILINSDNFNINETVLFFCQFKADVYARYGIDVDLEAAVEATIQNLITIGKFSAEEIEIARTFYSQIVQKIEGDELDQKAYFGRGSNEKENSLRFWKKKKHKKSKQSKTPELELPDRLAIGFVCALAGGFLCIIPGGQIYGIELILIGGAFALEGLAQGEKPYYVDPVSGQRIDTSGPNPINK